MTADGLERYVDDKFATRRSAFDSAIFASEVEVENANSTEKRAELSCSLYVAEVTTTSVTALSLSAKAPRIRSAISSARASPLDHVSNALPAGRVRSEPRAFTASSPPGSAMGNVIAA